MCGIVGVVRADGARVEPALVESMCNAITHRGPDDEGIHVDAGVGIGMRRLAIVDLDCGHQPMHNEDKTLWVVFNGEIYNHDELRRTLEGRGHRFLTRSDTEVIVHGFEEWGTDVVRHLRGMFAIAVWDEHHQRLLLARDRVGKKPLFYAEHGGTLYFASELQALLRCPVSRDLDHTALWHYLTFLCVPAPRTAFRAVRKLEPGHVLVWQQGTITTERYWHLDFSRKLQIDIGDAQELVLAKLREAVRLRMLADVPVGAFLSGGIDSSAVVALMAEASSTPVQTFSIGFEEKDFDELSHARRVAEMVGSEHHEFVVRPDALEVLPELVQHYGEPYADWSAIPTYYVARETRRHVTVALSGDGGDEAFAGYRRYGAMQWAGRIQRTPAGRSMCDHVGRLAVRNPRSRLGELTRFAAAAQRPPVERYLRWMSVADAETKWARTTPEFRTLATAAEDRDVLTPWLSDDRLDIIDRCLRCDTHVYLPDDLLTKVDIASMAVSLEVRAPFLDHEVLELAASLPASFKWHRGGKHVLKQALAGIVPHENLHRRKMGFGVPVGAWLRGPLRQFSREHLLSDTARGRWLFPPAVVRGVLDEHDQGRADHSFQIWTWLMLELWFQRFVDAP
ncbi:MAG: asparagine synthase (glutamine-hydrolyzing) [Phycisphaerales bacterium]